MEDLTNKQLKDLIRGYKKEKCPAFSKEKKEGLIKIVKTLGLDITLIPIKKKEKKENIKLKVKPKKPDPPKKPDKPDMDKPLKDDDVPKINKIESVKEPKQYDDLPNKEKLKLEIDNFIPNMEKNFGKDKRVKSELGTLLIMYANTGEIREVRNPHFTRLKKIFREYMISGRGRGVPFGGTSMLTKEFKKELKKYTDDIDLVLKKGSLLIGTKERIIINVYKEFFGFDLEEILRENIKKLKVKSLYTRRAKLNDKFRKEYEDLQDFIEMNNDYIDDHGDFKSFNSKSKLKNNGAFKFLYNIPFYMKKTQENFLLSFVDAITIGLDEERNDIRQVVAEEYEDTYDEKDVLKFYKMIRNEVNKLKTKFKK